LARRPSIDIISPSSYRRFRGSFPAVETFTALEAIIAAYLTPTALVGIYLSRRLTWCAVMTAWAAEASTW